MIKLKSIVNEVLKEGGKLFGAKASRVTTEEMNTTFNEVKSKLSEFFIKMELSKALKSKLDHGDIDIVFINSILKPVKNTLFDALGKNVKEYSRNDTIHSILYHSDSVNKDVHIDFIESGNEEDFMAQHEYLSFNDFSGIIGVLARQLGYSYSIEGFFKVFVDKTGKFHKILITKNLKDGLKIMGYDAVLSTYDNIENPDDIVKFISSSPFFDSSYYVGQTMNHSDRKRVRAGRPTADYIRKSLIDLHKSKSIDDSEYFFKKFFSSKYVDMKNEEERINSITIPKSIYGGEWLMLNFPEIKAGPVIGKVKKYWYSLYGDKLDDVPENELKLKTAEFLKTV
jgi:hypothetical protein